jgi:N-acyl-D-amino-acid deacylase
VYDIKITNGTIVDGTGAPGYRGDVGILSGRIVALGSAPDDAIRTIDAKGKVVSPGFIDVHTHYDPQIVWDNTLSPSSWQGVTTVLMGTCGFGVAPTRAEQRSYLLHTLKHVEDMDINVTTAGLGDWGFETFAEYMDLLERNGMLLNVAVQVGHTPVRVWVMGEDAKRRKEATPEEIEGMKQVVREAMAVGAIGFATSNSPAHSGDGGIPVPSRWTTEHELTEIVSVLGELGWGVFQATWGPEVTPESIERIVRATGVPVCDPGIGPAGEEQKDRWERFHKAIDIIDRLKADGLIWRPQTGVLPNTFEVGLANPFMFAIDQPAAAMRPARPLDELFVPIMDMETEGERLAAYQQPEFRQRFIEMTDEPGWNTVYWPRLAINYVPTRPELEGRMLLDVAKEQGRNPADLMLDLCLETNLEAAFGAISGTSETYPDRQLELYRSDRVVLGLGDAGAHQSQLFDGRYPARLLGTWVRDRGLELERAVYLLTKSAADIYGIEDRGELRVGLAADVVVFDPDTIQDGPLERVNDLPGGGRRLISKPKGIDAIIVNGTIINEHGKDVYDPDGRMPGHLLRKFRLHKHFEVR